MRGISGLFLSLGIAWATLPLAGCGTALGLSSKPDQLRKVLDTESKAYVGVLFDAHALATWPSEIAGYCNPMVWLVAAPIYLYVVIDIAPSALMDTVLLPVTLSTTPAGAPPDSPEEKGSTESP